jgi:hypothetical protein
VLALARDARHALSVAIRTMEKRTASTEDRQHRSIM